MLRRDERGFIMDQTGDGGDSANRAGLLALLGSDREKLWMYEVEKGLAARHPSQAPWNNPWNFTRDQLVPYMAGLWRQGEGDTFMTTSFCTHAAKRIFWRHARRGFLAQNWERDYPGTTKYPWPHEYDDKTDGAHYSKWFDGPDLLPPGDVWHLILCARIWPLYWFGLIGYPWLVLDIVAHGLTNKSNDEGQIIARCIVAGKWFVRIYKKVKPDWAEALEEYWTVRRNMSEMKDMIVTALTRY